MYIYDHNGCLQILIPILINYWSSSNCNMSTFKPVFQLLATILKLTLLINNVAVIDSSTTVAFNATVAT